jgi:biopolymer transport protein TolR
MDLSFLLLVTFIITFPLLEQGVPVNLPKAATKDLKHEKSRTITIDRQGNLYFDEKPVSEEELNAQVTALGKGDPEATVLLRADEAIAYGRVVGVVKALYQAGISRMSLVTQAEERRRR